MTRGFAEVKVTERSPLASRLLCPTVPFYALHSRSRDRTTVRSRLSVSDAAPVSSSRTTVARRKKKGSPWERPGITVVPVLRPVTDCRPFERLGLDQTGILGGRETSRIPRPPGKKGVGSARRSPTRIRHRPSPPTWCCAWFPRLHLSPFLVIRESSPTSVVFLAGHPHGRLGPTAPLLRLASLSHSRPPPQPPVIQPWKCARSSWSLEGDTRGDFGPSRRIEARRGSRFGPFLLLAYPLALVFPLSPLYVTRSRIVSRARES